MPKARASTEKGQFPSEVARGWVGGEAGNGLTTPHPSFARKSHARQEPSQTGIGLMSDAQDLPRLGRCDRQSALVWLPHTRPNPLPTFVSALATSVLRGKVRGVTSQWGPVTVWPQAVGRGHTPMALGYTGPHKPNRCRVGFRYKLLAPIRDDRSSGLMRPCAPDIRPSAIPALLRAGAR